MPSKWCAAAVLARPIASLTCRYGCDVVVFDQHAVEQAEAVVVAAAVAHGALFEPAQARRGFARIEQARFFAERLRRTARGCGDSGKMHHQVERQAFALEQIGKRAADLANARLRCDLLAIAER